MSAISVPIVLAPIIGPTIGGLLLDHAGWRWIFLVNLPVGVIALFAAARLLPADQPEDAGRLDFLGLALLAAGLVGITYGLAETSVDGVARSVLVPLVVGDRAGASSSARCASPTAARLRLYTNGAFSAASLTILPRWGAVRRHDPHAAVLPDGPR